ncbi:cytochrome-c domain-containing protein (plasmid) [Sinorhizobium fredii]|uniref:Cytochrome-c domain-containing protein n=2 Tax=Rhizobium fredii TaxID=380 RepID=A0A2L0HB26_RHIFR|nr:cytochrome-c domain-containing protein [Sinorhizobium fredii]
MRANSGWKGAFLVVALSATAILVYGGYTLKAASERRAAAIAIAGGEPDNGPALLARYGCRGCHAIPGVAGAGNRVGPPLNGLGDSVYIAGVVPNTPDNLVRWIEKPHEVDPRTAMPATGISKSEARDVAAYLYSLR